VKLMSLLRRNLQNGKIVVVSGLPRSGTSMMMQMLQAGGMPILADAYRAPDMSNPRGYYEYEPVKRLHQGATDWMKKAYGKAVKVVSPQLIYLPDSYHYSVIFMQRPLNEVLHSQTAMRAGDAVFEMKKMRQEYERHLITMRQWLDAHASFSTLYVDYHEVLQQPEAQSKRIATFLSNVSPLLDTEAMQAVVDPSLHRQRQTE
jgi:hypothetical protein